MSVPEREEISYVKRMSNRAVLARVAIFMLSTYLMIASFSFPEYRDAHILQIPFLDTSVVFFLAGLLGFPMVIWPKMRYVLLPWLFVLGLACLGRAFTVAFGGDLFTFAEKLRASGWVTTWVLSLVAVLQIQAAEILHTRSNKWSG